MTDRELVEQAAHAVLFRSQEGESEIPTLDEGPDDLELRFGDEWVLVLIPGERTTTVEVKRPTTGALVESASAGGRDYETLASELEEIYERHAGADT
jgi:hypothetical protein